MKFSKQQLVLLVCIGIHPFPITASLYYSGSPNGNLPEVTEVFHLIQGNTTSVRCLFLVIKDGGHFFDGLSAMEFTKKIQCSSAIFEMKVDHGYNQTTIRLLKAISLARQLRLQCWDVTVALMTKDSFAFLDTFGNLALRGRLLQWTTRLVILVGLHFQEIKNVFVENYVFSFMNTIIITQDDINRKNQFGIYCYLPYTEEGGKTFRIASLSTRNGITYSSNIHLFPEKYWNFHGATINVTATTYKPLWVEKQEKKADGTGVIQRSGMDYFLFATIAKKLNFHFEVIPITYWSEALDLTSKRKSFMTPVYHAVLHHRLKRFDYTHAYTYAFISFGMAKPKLTTNWLNLYYPLADEVWILILGFLLMIPFVLHMILRYEVNDEVTGPKSFKECVHITFASLLTQSVTKMLPEKNSSRVLMIAWLFSALVLGTAYQGSLIAALTLPRYPLRPETIGELVESTDTVTIMAWGADFVDFFKNSGSQLYMRLADIMVVGVDTIEGLQKTLQRRQAHLETIHKMQQDIAEYFTYGDGSSPIYIGRESIMPALAAWPIPHDAPYTPQLDFCLGAVVEAGLYRKWTEDMIILTRKESRQRQRSSQQDTQEENDEIEFDIELKEITQQKERSLKLTQFLGPLLCLSFGLTIGFFLFLAEMHSNIYLSKCTDI